MSSLAQQKKQNESDPSHTFYLFFTNLCVPFFQVFFNRCSLKFPKQNAADMLILKSTTRALQKVRWAITQATGAQHLPWIFQNH